MSMQLRVTQRSLSMSALAGLQMNLNKLGDLQQQMTSGKQISRPSDSPTGTIEAMQFRADIRAQTQYSRNADDALGWLGSLDTALNASTTSIQRVRDLTVQGISAGTDSTPGAREAIALEVDQTRQSIISNANATYLGRPIFGGTTAGSAAYDAQGNYVGDAGAVNRTIGGGVQIRVDAAGSNTFGAGPTQLFTVLSDISDHLRTDPSKLSADLANLDTAFKTLQAQRSDIGARYNRISQTKQNTEDHLLDLKTQLSDVEDIDLPKTITELQLQQTAYQAALSATAKVIQPSLMDFLK